jgi:XPG I-region
MGKWSGKQWASGLKSSSVKSFSGDMRILFDQGVDIMGLDADIAMYQAKARYQKRGGSGNFVQSYLDQVQFYKTLPVTVLHVFGVRPNKKKRRHADDNNAQAAQVLNVTFQERSEVIDSLREGSIPYLVAPSEADHQLGYLFQNDLIDGVFSMDQDLIAHGIGLICFIPTTKPRYSRDTAGTVSTSSVFEVFQRGELPKKWSEGTDAKKAWLLVATALGTDYNDNGAPGLGVSRLRTLFSNCGRNVNSFHTALVDQCPDFNSELNLALAGFGSAPVYDPRTRKIKRYTYFDDVKFDFPEVKLPPMYDEKFHSIDSAPIDDRAWALGFYGPTYKDGDEDWNCVKLLIRKAINLSQNRRLRYCMVEGARPMVRLREATEQECKDVIKSHHVDSSGLHRHASVDDLRELLRRADIIEVPKSIERCSDEEVAVMLQCRGLEATHRHLLAGKLAQEDRSANIPVLYDSIGASLHSMMIHRQASYNDHTFSNLQPPERFKYDIQRGQRKKAEDLRETFQFSFNKISDRLFKHRRYNFSDLARAEFRLYYRLICDNSNVAIRMYKLKQRDRAYDWVIHLKVPASYSKKLYKVRVRCNSDAEQTNDGYVGSSGLVDIYCSCAAGVSGVCTHAAVAAYAICDITSESCTSTDCKWQGVTNHGAAGRLLSRIPASNSADFVPSAEVDRNTPQLQRWKRKFGNRLRDDVSAAKAKKVKVEPTKRRLDFGDTQ